jgi:hypothetical protein
MSLSDLNYSVVYLMALLAAADGRKGLKTR